MKNKPDYKGFYEYFEPRKNLGIPYSLNDLIELAFRFHLPIPRYVIDAGRVRRDDLINKLVYKWRKAENYFIETGDDSLKWKVKEIQDRLHLNAHEKQLLENLCNDFGI